MSIFSGFATRKQEERYNHYIVSIITLLQDKLLELMALCRCPQNVIYEFQLGLKESVKKIASHMREMEKSKYLPPKISPLLATALGMSEIEANFDRCSSQDQVLERDQQQPARHANVRISLKTSSGHPRSISRDNTRRKHIYDTLKKNGRHQQTEAAKTVDLQKFDMEELLKSRPALPRRVTIPGRRMKMRAVNLYEINEFQQDDLMVGGQSLPEDDRANSSVTQTLHSSKLVSPPTSIQSYYKRRLLK